MRVLPGVLLILFKVWVLKPVYTHIQCCLLSAMCSVCGGETVVHVHRVWCNMEIVAQMTECIWYIVLTIPHVTVNSYYYSEYYSQHFSIGETDYLYMYVTEGLYRCVPFYYWTAVLALYCAIHVCTPDSGWLRIDYFYVIWCTIVIWKLHDAMLF